MSKVLRKFKVTGGLGRLCQFPKTVEVMAENEEEAHWAAMNPIRRLITEQDFEGNDKAPMLAKIINSDTITEIKEND
jgi:hypothetical protein